MKLKLLILIITFCYSYSQNVLTPDPIIWNITGLQNKTNSNIQGIRKGWNWENELKKLDEALYIDYNHYSLGQWDMSENIHKFGSNMNFINCVTPNGLENFDPIVSNDYKPSVTQAQAVQFEPALDVSSGEFVPLPNDNTGAVFGFKARKSEFASDNSIPHNFVLDKSRYSGSYPVTVLSEVDAGSELVDITNFGDGLNANDSKSMGGEAFYLTINLKALEEINASNEDEIVLRIKMPKFLFKYNDKADKTDNSTIDTQFIKFRETPDGISQDPSTYTKTSLGNYRDIIPNPTDEILITGKMLNNEDYITLYSYFTCAEDVGNPDPDENERLQNKENHHQDYSSKLGKGIIHDFETEIDDGTYRITHMDIEIEYFGTVDVAIDWIRIESPQYRKLLTGQFDQDIYNVLNDQLTKYISDSQSRQNFNIFRLYGSDEIWANNWLSQRYLNKLVDGLLTTETHIAHTVEQYIHCTGFKEMWYGSADLRTHAIGDATGNTAAPYIKKGFIKKTSDPDLIEYLTKEEGLNLKMGYTGNYGKYGWTDEKLQSYCSTNFHHFRDTLNSYYETFLLRTPVSDDDPCDFFDDEGNNMFELALEEDIHNLEYDEYSDMVLYYSFQSNQMLFEHQLYKLFYKHPGLLFGNTPFWSNIWNTNSFFLSNDGPNSYMYHQARPRTGEELRYSLWSNLILGSKGYF